MASLTFTRSLAEVADEVAADDAGKWDALAPAAGLTLQDARLHFPGAAASGHDAGLDLSRWATAQACQKLGIPAQYFMKCPNRLKDENFNWWVRNRDIGRALAAKDGDPDEAWLIRSKGATVRGVLSSRYRRLDNRQLLASLLPIVNAQPERYKVGLCRLEAESFHLRLVDPTLGRDVLPGDRLMVGVHVANSEVGARAVTVDALVFRLVCSNGLIRKLDGKSLMRQRHVAVAEPRFAGMLGEALREAVAVAAGFLERVVAAAKVPVPDPDLAVQILGEAWEMSREAQEFARFGLHGEAAPDTLYGLVNGVTNAAQRLPGMEERYRLESLAASLVDAPPTSPLLGRILRPHLN